MTENNNMATESAGSKVRPRRRDHNIAELLESRTTLHQESHCNHSDVIPDIIIGFADSLTVLISLTVRLFIVKSLSLVILGSLAELFAESISMGLGMFLAPGTENKYYCVEEIRERKDLIMSLQAEERERCLR
jgi:hypothetical protein